MRNTIVSMTLPQSVEDMVQERLATGRYGSLEELFQKAFEQLQNQERLIDELHAAAADEAAGRVVAFEEFDRRIRTARGWMK